MYCRNEIESGTGSMKGVRGVAIRALNAVSEEDRKTSRTRDSSFPTNDSGSKLRQTRYKDNATERFTPRLRLIFYF